MARLSVPVLAVVLALSILLSACGAQTGAAGQPTAQNTSVTAVASGSASSGTSCPTSNTVVFAKTRFVLHAGEAFGVFHRYLYKPYRAGSFAHGAHGRLTAFIKAGLAALFIKREVRLAADDARANPTLCRVLVAPLAAIGNTISSAVSALRNGDASGLQAVNSAVSDAQSGAAKQGVTVPDNTTVTP